MFEHHCSDECLVALLDGELTPGNRRAAQRHLARCWACRTRLAEFESAIHQVSWAVRNESFPSPAWVFRAKVRFQERSQGIREAAERRQSERQWFTPAPGWHSLTWAVAAALCLTITAMYFYLRDPAKVAAAELLRKAQVADEQMTHLQPGEALRRRLVVHRKSYRTGQEIAATHECWLGISAPVSGSSTAQNGLLTELQNVYRENGLDWDEPLAASNVDHWRAGLRSPWEKISYGNTVVLTVGDREPSASGADRLRLMRLSLRTPDLHTVRQDLVTDSAEYSITETSLAVVEVPPLHSTATATREQPKNVRPEIQPAMPRLSALADRIEVLYLLHRAGTCRNGSVLVEANASGGLEIRGVVSTDAQKKELEGELNALPAVAHVELQSTEEAARSAAMQQELTPRSPAEAPAMVFHSTSFALEPVLHTYFRRSGTAQWARSQTGELIDRLLGDSSGAASESAALIRLAAECTPEQFRELPVRARLLLLQMMQDHQRQMEQKLSGVNASLATVSMVLNDNGSVPVPAESIADDAEPAPDWREPYHQLSVATEQLESSIWDLLTDAKGPGADAHELESRVILAFSESSLRLQQSKAAIDIEFARAAGEEPRLAAQPRNIP